MISTFYFIILNKKSVSLVRYWEVKIIKMKIFYGKIERGKQMKIWKEMDIENKEMNAVMNNSRTVMKKAKIK